MILSIAVIRVLGWHFGGGSVTGIVKCTRRGFFLDVQNLYHQLNTARLRFLLDATRTDCSPMHLRGIHIRAIVIERLH